MLKFIPFQMQHAKIASSLHAACFPYPWPKKDFEKYANDPSILGTSVLVKEKFVGFILARKALDEAEIFTISVHPDYQKQGIGKELLKYNLNLLLRNEIKNVYLEVSEDNQGAIALYKRAGFLQLGKRPNYYRINQGIRRTAYLYKKIL